MKIEPYKRSYLVHGKDIEKHEKWMKKQFKVRKIKDGIMIRKDDYNDVVQELRNHGVKRITSSSKRNISVPINEDKLKRARSKVSLSEQRFYFSLMRQKPNSKMAKEFMNQYKYTNNDIRRVLDGYT